MPGHHAGYESPALGFLRRLRNGAFLLGERTNTYGTSGDTLNSGITFAYWATDGAQMCHIIGYEWRCGVGFFKDEC